MRRCHVRHMPCKPTAVVNQKHSGAEAGGKHATTPRADEVLHAYEVIEADDVPPRFSKAQIVEAHMTIARYHREVAELNVLKPERKYWSAEERALANALVDPEPNFDRMELARCHEDEASALSSGAS